MPAFDRTFDWSVKKYVSLDGTNFEDASVGLNLFNGQSSTVYWKIDYTEGAPVDSNARISGSVTMANPTGSAPFPFSQDAVVNSVDDVVSQTRASDSSATLTCPGAFPKTLKAGDSFTCTYTKTLANTNAGTNKATAHLSTGSDYSGSASFDPSTATPTVTDDSASLDDDRNPSFPTSVSGSSSVTYNETLGCGSSRTITNTAVLTERDSKTASTDSASVDITCYGLNVSKTAEPSFTRTYAWTIKKYVSLDGTTFEDASVVFKQFDGDSKTIYWKLVPTRDAGTDSAWHVTGTITVSNPAPIDAVGVEVSDSIAGVGAATVDCDPNTGGNQTTVNIPASGSVDCTYSADLPDATTRLNTGKATLAGNDYTGTKSIDFTGVSPTEVNATATLSDTNKGALGDATSGQSVEYTTDVACGVDRTITNTGTVHFGGSTATDDAAVTVDCLQLTVTKTATPSFTRTWTWQVAKSATNSELTLARGETYFQPYSVVYTATSQDSDWKVSGTITVSSPADAPTRQVTVSDVYAGNAATVDCTGGLPQDLAGGGTLNCTYSVDLPSALNGNNVATATLTNVPSGTTDFTSNSAGVTFSNPTSEIDETIAVSDTVPAGSYCTGVNAPVVGCSAGMVGTGPPSGNVSASASPKTFTYTRIIGPYGSGQCGTQTVDNTASFTTNDTGATADSSWQIVVTIPCPTGCTLTQGYWKTHSILGPTPFDDAWNNVPADPYAPAVTGIAENLLFFHSGQTWYEVFWTAPKGGNAYYILAHQYEAAVLNYLSGADATAIFPTLRAERPDAGGAECRRRGDTGGRGTERAADRGAARGRERGRAPGRRAGRVAGRGRRRRHE